MVIGRKQEKAILDDALKSDRSELVVVYGRRRIGKTYLVRNMYRDSIRFELSSLHRGTLNDQLKNFHLALSAHRKHAGPPADWLEAFHRLGEHITKDRSRRKKVIFIDEFPWLDTRRSRFLPAFSNFWNSYASKRKDLVVVICGSAASYMISKVIKNKGGLHNRISQRIQLMPFDLVEAEQLLQWRGVKFTRYDILRVYMAMGGVPHYLEKIAPGESVAQALDRLCFQRNGPLRAEFDNVFASLFDRSENHEAIVRVLGHVRKGLTRTAIARKSGLASGGTLTKTLTELEQSGFVQRYMPYRGVKDPLFRLIDEYSMFYIKFMEKSVPGRGGYWVKLQGGASYRIWSGFTFETVCMKHVDQIKFALGISGVHSEDASWIEKNGDKGAQIDLLIDRDDNVINVCEMKFVNAAFKIDKKYSSELANKVELFRRSTGTRKSVMLTMITTYGILENMYSRQTVQNELTMDDLFVTL